MDRKLATYPKDRPSYFCNRCLRAAHKSTLAQTVGVDGMALLTVIAHTEDAKRYSGPVTFYNQQLLPILGFAKWERLDNARKRLMDGGWLVYECQGKRKPGIYWTIIPAEFVEVNDTPLDEGLYTLDGYKQGYNEGYKQGYKEGIMRDINRGQSGIQTGDNEGDPSNLVPSPVPKPKKKESPQFDPTKASIPKTLETTAFIEAWADWCQHRREIKKKLTPTAVLKQLAELETWGVARAVAAIHHTIARGWTGIREPDGEPNGNGEPHDPEPPPRIVNAAVERQNVIDMRKRTGKIF